MLATRFIIVLCPATPIYLAAPSTAPKGAITRVKDDACRFDTFEAAMEVAQDITNWGGAQRVEQVAVDVPDTRSTIATDDDLFEIRDAATMAWTESQSRTAFGRTSCVIKAMLDLGIDCAADHREGAASPVTIYLADYLGNTAQFDWDPMIDGFDITDATTPAEPCPNADPNCDHCGGSEVAA